MRESSHDARLALEPRQRFGIARQVIGQDFDGDFATEPHVARAVDLPHSSRVDRRENLIGPQASARRLRHGIPGPILGRPRELRMQRHGSSPESQNGGIGKAQRRSRNSFVTFRVFSPEKSTDTRR